jgi:hypothetical protein
MLTAAGTLAGEKEKLYGLGKLSADAGSDSTSSLFSEDIADDIDSLGMSRTIILFIVVGISALRSSVTGSLRLSEIVRRPSCVFVSLFPGSGHWDVPMTVWD